MNFKVGIRNQFSIYTESIFFRRKIGSKIFKLMLSQGWKYDPSPKGTKIALFLVENHSSNTLIPLILENIPLNSTIISDKYSTYLNIKRNESRLER